MKQKIPLAILEALSPASNENLRFVQPFDEPRSMLVMKGKAPTNKFFFKIEKQENRPSGVLYRVMYKPKAKEDLTPANSLLSLDATIKALNKWLTLVAAYHTTPSIFDDPITKSYEEDFAAKFQIVDEDASYAGFNLEQQVFLDEYLNSVQSKLETLKEGRPEEEIRQLDDIEADVADLQKNISKESKKSVVQRLTRIWAKAQRVGLDVIKDIFVSVASDLIGKLITGKLP